MEIREILETNLVSNNLEVKFRIDEDTDEVIRTYTFDLDVILEYGYDIFPEPLDMSDLDEEYLDEEYEMEDFETEIDESELTLFMNEFFSITEKLPEAESY